jgi:hypothetical protein
VARRRGWIAIAGLGGIFAVNVNGCSLIGLGVGTAIDTRASLHEQLRGGEMVRVPAGSRVVLLLDDSTRVRGVYLGSERITDQEYRPVYGAWRANHPRAAGFPEIGESIQVTDGGKGVFRAFVAEGVEFQSWRLRPVPFDRDGWLVRSDGSRLHLYDVRDLALAGELPIATALRIDTDRGERRIAVDRVALVETPSSGRAALAGFLVGLAADAMIVIAIRDATRGPSCSVAPDIGTGWYSRASRPARSPERVVPEAPQREPIALR